MIYFRFLRSHPEVKLAKKYSLELKLANRRSEIQSTVTRSYNGSFLAFGKKSAKNFSCFREKYTDFICFFRE